MYLMFRVSTDVLSSQTWIILLVFPLETFETFLNITVLFFLQTRRRESLKLNPTHRPRWENPADPEMWLSLHVLWSLLLLNVLSCDSETFKESSQSFRRCWMTVRTFCLLVSGSLRVQTCFKVSLKWKWVFGIRVVMQQRGNEGCLHFDAEDGDLDWGAHYLAFLLRRR